MGEIFKSIDNLTFKRIFDMRSIISIFMGVVLLMVFPLSTFAKEISFKEHMVAVEHILDTDGKEKIIELYENDSGRTSYVKDSKGNIESKIHVDFNRSDIAKFVQYQENKILKTTNISLNSYSYKYEQKYSLSFMVDAGLSVWTVATIVALIMVSEGGAVFVLEPVKKKLKQIIATFILGKMANAEYMKNHGIEITYEQYSEYINRYGKKVEVIKTKAIDAEWY